MRAEDSWGSVYKSQAEVLEGLGWNLGGELLYMPTMKVLLSKKQSPGAEKKILNIIFFSEDKRQFCGMRDYLKRKKNDRLE